MERASRSKFDFVTGQDIESSDTKNSTKGKIEEIENRDNHSPNATRALITEETLTTENGDEGID